MMRRVISALMIILSLLIGFQRAILVMHFSLHQNAIEQKYCINKDQPALQCHGMCHLKKQLQKTTDHDSASTNSYQRIDMLPFSVTEFETRSLIINTLTQLFCYRDIWYSEPYREIFIPPPILGRS